MDLKQHIMILKRWCTNKKVESSGKNFQYELDYVGEYIFKNIETEIKEQKVNFYYTIY